jgi:hypothetical protein
MNRSGLLLLLFAPLLAVAAPVPKQELKAKIESKFGKIVDPKADSQFGLDGDALTVTLPAKEDRRFGYVKDAAEKSGLKRFDHTPRVEFARTGDFDLRVRVSFPLSADAETVEGKKDMYTGGGVKLVNKEGKLYWCGAVRRATRPQTHTLIRDGSPGTWSNDFRDTTLYEAFMSEETVWLRAVRTGDDLTFHASTDGKEWKETAEHRGAFSGDRADLALYAEHYSSKAHTVTFDQFSVEKPKAQKK